jgi:opacity protein-like surface antigen
MARRSSQSEEDNRGMKKKILISLLLFPIAAFAQESRQDVSISATSFSMAQTNGNSVQQTATITTGALASYRFMLTPRSALEANYSWAQNTQRYTVGSTNQARFLTRTQEMTAAYVLNFNLKRFNPFLEAGIGTLIFTPLAQAGTTELTIKQNTSIAALAGAGIAYELSPSWDIRAEYRGFLTKAPVLGDNGNPVIFNTHSYTIFNMPAIGIAYHF